TQTTLPAEHGAIFCMVVLTQPYFHPGQRCATDLGQTVEDQLQPGFGQGRRGKTGHRSHSTTTTDDAAAGAVDRAEQTSRIGPNVWDAFTGGVSSGHHHGGTAAYLGHTGRGPAGCSCQQLGVGTVEG